MMKNSLPLTLHQETHVSVGHTGSQHIHDATVGDKWRLCGKQISGTILFDISILCLFFVMFIYSLQ